MRHVKRSHLSSLLNKRRQIFSYEFSLLHLIIYPTWPHNFDPWPHNFDEGVVPSSPHRSAPSPVVILTYRQLRDIWWHIFQIDSTATTTAPGYRSGGTDVSTAHSSIRSFRQKNIHNPCYIANWYNHNLQHVWLQVQEKHSSLDVRYSWGHSCITPSWQSTLFINRIKTNWTGNTLRSSLTTTVQQHPARTEVIALSILKFCRTGCDTVQYKTKKKDQEQEQYSTTQACEIPNKQIWFRQKIIRATLC